MWRRLLRSASIPIGAAILGGTAKSVFPGPPAFPVVLIGVLTVLIWTLIGVGKLIFDLCHRRWLISGARLLQITACLPLAVIGAASGDYVHIALFYPSYRMTIAKSPDGPVRFPWGDAALTVLDGMHFRTLVFDRGGATEAVLGRQLGPDGLPKFTRHLIGNFYLEEIILN
jgi:hypothetical protein